MSKKKSTGTTGPAYADTAGALVMLPTAKSNQENMQRFDNDMMGQWQNGAYYVPGLSDRPNAQMTRDTNTAVEVKAKRPRKDKK